MRVQFEISVDLEERLRRYAPNLKMRQLIAEAALREWITRHEGRDKRLRAEQLLADVEALRPVVEEIVRTMKGGQA